MNGIIMLIDFDECIGEGSGNECEQECVNNQGGYSCTCIDGFELFHETECRGKVKFVIADRTDFRLSCNE